MKTKLVEIIGHEDGWKGTWYKTGQRHFVRQYHGWPSVMSCRWGALSGGGIHEEHCRVVSGLSAWIGCAWATVWMRP